MIEGDPIQATAISMKSHTLFILWILAFSCLTNWSISLCYWMKFVACLTWISALFTCLNSRRWNAIWCKHGRILKVLMYCDAYSQCAYNWPTSPKIARYSAKVWNFVYSLNSCWKISAKYTVPVMYEKRNKVMIATSKPLHLIRLSRRYIIRAIKTIVILPKCTSRTHVKTVQAWASSRYHFSKSWVHSSFLRFDI